LTQLSTYRIKIKRLKRKMMCKKEKQNQNDGGLILLWKIIQMRKKINKDSNKIEKKYGLN
jgi:hypothetical protein